MIGNLVNRTIG